MADLPLRIHTKKWCHGVDGFAHHDGKPWIIRGLLPYEECVVLPLYQKGQVSFAIRDSQNFVHNPSADRITPTCPAFLQCGGCDALHIRPTVVAEQKRLYWIEMLDRQLRATGNTAFSSPECIEQLRIPNHESDAHRRRCRVHIDAQGNVGFLGIRTHRVMSDANCFILHPLLRGAIHDLQTCVEKIPALKSERPDISLLCNEERVAMALHVTKTPTWINLLIKELSGSVVQGLICLNQQKIDYSHAQYTIPGLIAPEYAKGTLAVDAGVFTQPSPWAGTQIIKAVLDASQDWQSQKVLELFSGAGHLTIPLRQQGAWVDSVEGFGRSVEYARIFQKQLRHENFGNTYTGHIDQKLLSQHPRPLQNYSLWLVDPPRTGIPDWPLLLKQCRASTMVMISCDIATGVRDIVSAMSAGFHLDSVTPIDSFRHTRHLETVAVLHR